MFLWSAAVAAAFGLGGGTLVAGAGPVADAGVVGVWSSGGLRACGAAASLAEARAISGRAEAGGCCAKPPTETAKMTAAPRPMAELGRDQIASLIEQVLHLWGR